MFCVVLIDFFSLSNIWDSRLLSFHLCLTCSGSSFRQCKSAFLVFQCNCWCNDTLWLFSINVWCPLNLAFVLVWQGNVWLVCRNHMLSTLEFIGSLEFFYFLRAQPRLTILAFPSGQQEYFSMILLRFLYERLFYIGLVIKILGVICPIITN